MMNKYFYTFGTDPMFPRYKGHVEVHADSWEEAHKKFSDKFPCRRENVINCAFFYDEPTFDEIKERWRGRYSEDFICHEVIK